MVIRGDADENFDRRRYMKFEWTDATFVPPIGSRSHVTQGAFRIFHEGRFVGSQRLDFPAAKKRVRLDALKRCAYCDRDKDDRGQALKLTSEHIIPEALGAGIEVPEASCADCQHVTAEFESSVTTEMFDAVRKGLGLIGKEGVLPKQNFPVDIGGSAAEITFLNAIDHPTILTLPMLFPASAYSDRPSDQNGFFNLQVYNVNCRKEALERNDVRKFSSALIDTARFCQVIAKIAHVACVHTYRGRTIQPLLGRFLRTRLPPRTPSTSHFNHVGCLWQAPRRSSTNLHEVETGRISWLQHKYVAARVQLFASLDMPSYYVVVGHE